MIACLVRRDQAAQFLEVDCRLVYFPDDEVRIVDQENNSLPPGEVGELICRGPNVMKGYMGQPEKTAEVLRDGWYVTGDIALVDDERNIRAGLGKALELDGHNVLLSENG